MFGTYNPALTVTASGALGLFVEFLLTGMIVVIEALFQCGFS
jgi:hypothetical protein